MKSLKVESKTEINIKKSRFICYLNNVSSEEEAKKYILNIRKLHPDANHHCYAYRVGGTERVSDDGEPSKTAGMPMLNVLAHNDMVNTIAITVRYFGGIKLGAGGLVRAYTESVVAGLENSNISTLIPGYEIDIICTYSDIDKINYILHRENLNNAEVKYDQNVTFNLKLSKIKFNIIKEKIVEYKHLIKINIIEQITVVDTE